MPDIVGSLRRRAAGAACLTLVVACNAAAQSPPPDPRPDFQFLPRYDVAVMIAGLAHDDDRFSWDAHVGADLDLVDYGFGRFSILVDYQAVMGNQMQLFDPNQGNYLLEGSSSIRARSTEYAAMFHHVSRHLSDRAKNHAIAMNVLGGRVLRQVPLGAATLDIRAEVGRIIQHSYVDYTWRARVHLVARRPVSARLGLVARASGETYGVNPKVAGRDRQNGGRLEGGVRVAGRAAAIELFAGYERVVDADPLDRQPRRWAFAGFRVLN